MHTQFRAMSIQFDIERKHGRIVRLFHLQLEVHGLTGDFGDGDIACGCIKNYYLISENQLLATESAKRRMIEELGAKPSITLNGKGIQEIIVNKCVTDFRVWKSLSSEGFIFFPEQT